MKLIVGLGNPGDKYKQTRHNIGFNVVDNIANKLNIDVNKHNFEGVFYINQDFVLAKPLTFMNKSGTFVEKIAHYYNISPHDILIIRDDLDTELGQVKLRLSGGSGGHNGMKDIIEKLKSNEINQLKIGIGRPKNEQLSISSFVLKQFDEEELPIVEKIIDSAADAVISSIYNGFKNTMNNFNRGKK